MVRSPEKLAWLTLLGAQIACLVITFSTLGSGWWFFFSSSVDLTADLRVGRGSVGILQPGNASQEAVNRNRQLIGGDQLIIDDAISQGTIEFLDTNNELVVANVTIFSGSAQLISARRPRFNLGDNRYEIRLNHTQGRLEIQIPPDLPHDFIMTIRGTQAEIRLNRPGFYILNSNTNLTSVFARQGTAEIKPYHGQLTHVPTGHTASVDAHQEIAEIMIVRDDLLNDPMFAERVADQPSPWGCEDGAEPVGQYQFEIYDGRQAIHIERTGAANGTQVGCRQTFGLPGPDGGLDVTGLKSIRIRATLQILSQSVTICGVEASECPVYLQITYINQAGAEQKWYHGFYAFEYPEEAFRLNRTDYCDTCIEPHDRVNPDTWYTYESRNMLEFPDNFKPLRIKEVRFYSSGHNFEVAVGEVALIVESND